MKFQTFLMAEEIFNRAKSTCSWQKSFVWSSSYRRLTSKTGEKNKKKMKYQPPPMSHKWTKVLNKHLSNEAKMFDKYMNKGVISPVTWEIKKCVVWDFISSQSDKVYLENRKFWRGHGEKTILIHYQWEWKALNHYGGSSENKSTIMWLSCTSPDYTHKESVLRHLACMWDFRLQKSQNAGNSLM